MARRDDSGMSLKLSPLKASPVLTDSDIEIFRLIRNECAGLYSKNNQIISRSAHKTYWEENKLKLLAFLYEDDSEDVVGIGSLRLDEKGRKWGFVAVSEMGRGKGYSAKIMRHLLDIADGDVWGYNRVDNPGSMNLCVDSGNWMMIDRNGPVITVLYKKEWQIDYENTSTGQ